MWKRDGTSLNIPRSDATSWGAALPQNNSCSASLSSDSNRVFSWCKATPRRRDELETLSKVHRSHPDRRAVVTAVTLMTPVFTYSISLSKRFISLEQHCFSMSDTVKIKRPHFERKSKGAGGRVEHDNKGNAIWVRSRATDTHEIAMTDELSLVEEPRHRARSMHASAPRKVSPTKARR
jgi:hypothetical protein